jgi:hypothetical protein
MIAKGLASATREAATTASGAIKAAGRSSARTAGALAAGLGRGRAKLAVRPRVDVAAIQRETAATLVGVADMLLRETRQENARLRKRIEALEAAQPIRHRPAATEPPRRASRTKAKATATSEKAPVVPKQEPAPAAG